MIILTPHAAMLDRVPASYDARPMMLGTVLCHRRRPAPCTHPSLRACATSVGLPASIQPWELAPPQPELKPRTRRAGFESWAHPLARSWFEAGASNSQSRRVALVQEPHACRAGLEPRQFVLRARSSWQREVPVEGSRHAAAILQGRRVVFLPPSCGVPSAIHACDEEGEHCAEPHPRFRRQ